ncbi:hypothetical protein FOA43_001327 [Brettanomyces nanus]|uniref:Eisosome protein 1 n=1 Tax=Eeniella nana TaxID=13502 RepID=A0A875RNQ1_EENNA|nr:uncharacterized protein FOA43_001327 [Brettanomyces nanus]QPG74010.1 hypothetical protein FOA43_001327 [Brettanomyces nanus]
MTVPSSMSNSASASASNSASNSLSSPHAKNHRFASVYQTNDRPLSEEAIYKARQRYGMFQSPAKVGLGVDAYASDTAALLAASSDLSIHPYKPSLSADAATAALYANTDSSPIAWKRNNVDPNAEYAAISAKSQSSQSEDVTDSSDSGEPQKKAAYASLYRRDHGFPVRSSSQAGNNISAPATPAFSISSITKVARESAARSINSRMNPPVSSTDAIVSPGRSNRHAMTISSSSSATGTINLAHITSLAQASATREIDLRLRDRKTGHGIPTASDTASNNSLLASRCATASKTTGVLPDYAVSERETLKRNTLVNKVVLATAFKRASDTMKQIDNNIISKGVFSNKELNQKALQVAQERANKVAEDPANDSSKINLGGGLFMSFAAINALAASVVQPALREIDSKAKLQREVDQHDLVVSGNIKQRKIEHKKELKVAKEADKQMLAAEVEERRVQLEGDKEGLRGEQEELLKQHSEEVAAKETEFDEQVKHEEEEKQQIDGEREEKLQALNDTKAEKDGVRESEISEIKEKRDHELAPIEEELGQEKEKLAELTKVREEKEAFYNEHRSRVDIATTQLERTEYQLSKLKEQLEITEKDSGEASTQAAKEVEEASELGKSSEKTIAEKKESLESMRRERSELEGQIEELDGKRREVLGGVNSTVRENHKEAGEINSILPDHLKKEVPKLKEEKDKIDLSKFTVDDSAIKEPAEVKPEPEDIPDKIWNEEDDKIAKEKAAKEKAAKEKAVKDKKEATRAASEASKEANSKKRSGNLFSNGFKKVKEAPKKAGFGKKLVNLFNEPAPLAHKKATATLKDDTIDDNFSGFSQDFVNDKKN